MFYNLFIHIFCIKIGFYLVMSKSVNQFTKPYLFIYLSLHSFINLFMVLKLAHLKKKGGTLERFIHLKYFFVMRWSHKISLNQIIILYIY